VEKARVNKESETDHQGQEKPYYARVAVIKPASNIRVRRKKERREIVWGKIGKIRRT